jgi:subtilisin family serine protease
MNRAFLLLLALAVAVSTAFVVSPSFAADKIKVDSLDDLPDHSYPVAGSATALLADDAAFAAFTAKVRADLEGDLEAYDITDPSTLQKYHTALANAALLEGRWDAAIVHLDVARDLEQKPASKAMAGLTARSYVAARRELGDAAGIDAIRPVFIRELSARLAPLDWDLVQDMVQQAHGSLQMLSENMLGGMVQMQMDPIVAKSGELGGEVARGLLNLGLAKRMMLPLRDDVVATYGALIEQHQVAKDNIWPARSADLEPGQGLAPVVIGIWDSGVDVPVFGATMWTNPGEQANGKDDDGNGFVDDLHGIAFDLDANPNPELLHPLGDMEGRVAEAKGHIKGVMDLQAAIASPEADAVRAAMAQMPPDQVKGFMESLGFYGLYAHGTHVAGISSAGNAYAKLLCARISFDYHTPPQPMTHEIAKRWADSYARTAKYFEAAGVRVVNMSWGWSFREIESGLEANGVGASAEDRARLAGEMLDIIEAGLKGAIVNSPGILYVSAAGNDDNDVAFDRVIPSSWDLPNLLVVGAVDQAGDPTSFTSGGKTVRVYANGFEVESFVPGGTRMPMSGTSMASPQVCNLAGKLFAKNPNLTPVGAVRLIVETAEQNAEHPEISLIDPLKALAAAK